MTERPVTGRTPAEELAEVIAGHGPQWQGRDMARLALGCACGGAVADGSRGWYERHVAAVVLAHLETEGWAKGREEWGVHQDGFTVKATDEADARKWADRVYSPVFRRRVTDWEPA